MRLLATAVLLAACGTPDDPAEPCGNGEVDPDELCDDGNDRDDDDCASDCTPAEPFHAFDQRIGQLLTDWDVPGATVAVTYQGRLVLVRAYGQADRVSDEAMQPTSRFRIASVSKPITAAAVMLLVERGDVALDAPAFAYLPDLPAPTGTVEDPRLAAITVRHLLEHAGGWDRAISGDPMFASSEVAAILGEDGPATGDMTVRWLRGQPLDFDPGSRYAYSNAGYCVLGRIIEAVTGDDYESFVRDSVLAPAGAPGMAIGGTRIDDRADGEVRYHGYPGEPPTASVYPGDGDVPWEYGGWYQRAQDANGGWIASAVELSRVILAIDGRDTVDDVLAPSSIAAMTARPDLPSWVGTDSFYGLGLAVRPVDDDGNWWHDGSLPGTGALMVRSWHDFTWVGLFNTRPLDGGGFSGAIDGALWEAQQTVATWPDYDLFERY